MTQTTPPTLFRLFVAFVGVYFYMGSLYNTLSPINATEAPYGQLLGIVLGLIGLGGLARRPATLNRILALYWPALIPVGFALSSLLWAADPELAIRPAGGLVLTTIFAVWLSERFSPKMLFKLLVAAAIGLCLTSWFQILIQPQLGVHQASDIQGFAHAGSWRGTFSHKNDFGRAIALSGLIFTTAAVTYRRYALLFWLANLQAAFLILQSSSSQAILLLLIPSAIVLLMVITIKMRVQARTAILVTAIPLAVALYFAIDVIVTLVLDALGKDATLTGRTDIWVTVFAAAQEKFLIGGGFGSGWSTISDRLVAIGDVVAGHAHNGYLDLLVDLGIIGVLTAIGFSLYLGRRSLVTILRRGPDPIALLGVGYVVFYLLGNVAGSFLLQQNSIYWVAPVAIFCTLQRMRYPRLAEGPVSDRPVSRVPILSSVAKPSAHMHAR